MKYKCMVCKLTTNFEEIVKHREKTLHQFMLLEE